MKLATHKGLIFRAACIVFASYALMQHANAETTVPTVAAPAATLAKPDNMMNADMSIPFTKTPEYIILQPSDQATFSSETSASVAEVNVKEGSSFKKDDVLVALDCRVQKADLDKSLAQQKATNAALKSAERLKSFDAISDYEVIKAKAEADMADAEVSKLGAIVDKCIIKAPFNGAVSKVMVHMHETVKPGDPLIKIVNTDHIIVELEVPSTWLKWLKVDSEFNVHINELNKSIMAKIVRINPAIEPVSQTVKIIGEMSDNDDVLMPGMSGQAMFPSNPEGTK